MQSNVSRSALAIFSAGEYGVVDDVGLEVDVDTVAARVGVEALAFIPCWSLVWNVSNRRWRVSMFSRTKINVCGTGATRQSIGYKNAIRVCWRSNVL